MIETAKNVGIKIDVKVPRGSRVLNSAWVIFSPSGALERHRVAVEKYRKASSMQDQSGMERAAKHILNQKQLSKI